MLKKKNETKTTSFSVEIGPKTRVSRDGRSGARIINIPFDFPSEENAVLIICKLKDEDWVPMMDIKKITLEFNEI